jgi:hypothetical protein
MYSLLSTYSLVDFIYFFHCVAPPKNVIVLKFLLTFIIKQVFNRNVFSHWICVYSRLQGVQLPHINNNYATFDNRPPNLYQRAKDVI